MAPPGTHKRLIALPFPTYGRPDEASIRPAAAACGWTRSASRRLSARPRLARHRYRVARATRSAVTGGLFVGTEARRGGAVDGQQRAADEAGLVGVQEQRRVRDVPGG